MPLVSLHATLQVWLSKYTLPPKEAPTFAMELADLELVKDCLALLLANSDGPLSTSQELLERLWPNSPILPSSGLPSDALIATGLAQLDSEFYNRMDHLRRQMNADSASVYVALSDS